MEELMAVSQVNSNKLRAMEYIDYIRKCKVGSVLNIKEPIFLPRFLKTLVLQLRTPVMCVSHSLRKETLVKSILQLCSPEERNRLEALPLYFDDTPDLDFDGMVKRILPVMMENNTRLLVIKSSARFLKTNETKLKRLASHFQIIVITSSI